MVKQYRFKVEPIVRANGNCPGQEFYDSLDKETVKPKFIAIFRAINQSKDGYLRGDKLEKLHGDHTHDLWEMKVRYKHMWYRMLCFRDGSTWMVTHGFTKDSNDTPRNEIDKGVAIKKEYEEMNENVARR